ncbi:hypothetical protein HDU86_002168 [Geranomyces michiganensis]|nr:hypothetical protein HDU86_002168 [Geranomyces michiganensis]
MLVGTALIVIIPEGVETLYSLQREQESRRNGDGGHAFEAHKYVGAALAVGFVAMFVLDNLGSFSGGGGGGRSAGHIVAVNDFRGGGGGGGGGEEDGAEWDKGKQGISTATVGLMVHAAADGVALGAASASDRGSLEVIVFLAIMLHKAPSAFGLATYLLANSTESLHPSSLDSPSTTTTTSPPSSRSRFRRTNNNTTKSIQKHLVAFSLAAPLAAIATFALLSGDAFATSTGNDNDITTAKWTGVLLLFSAGTFLYVATMHILPEVYQNAAAAGGGAGGTKKGGGGGGGGGSSSDHGHSHRKLSVVQIVCLIAGVFTPLVLAVEHSH